MLRKMVARLSVTGRILRASNMRMIILRIVSYAAIPVGFIAWVMLRPLFSIVIILSLAYADELYLREKNKAQRDLSRETQLVPSIVADDETERGSIRVNP